MDPEQIGLGATLYHLAQAESLASILEHGLLSTQMIYKKLQTSDEEQSRIRLVRRKQSFVLYSSLLGLVTIRDQRPLPPASLSKALEGSGLTNEAWLDLLDKRVFFWADRSRFEALAKSYKSSSLVLLEVCTRALLARYCNTTQVCEINGGYAMRKPALRNSATYESVATYRRTSKRRIVELTVTGSVNVMERVRIPDGSTVRLLKRAVKLSSVECLIPEG